jgi:glucose-6-phosphate isomerase
MLTSNVKYQSFKIKKKKLKVKNIFKNIKNKFDKKSDLFLNSLLIDYKNSFNINDLKKYKRFNSYNIIGMGGSSLGAKAIYSFLKDRIKKKFNFIDNLNTQKPKYTKEKQLNIVISKSGNTLETIVNFNTQKNIKNTIFITEKKNNYLRNIANKMKKEIFEHRDFIGGRYSVLSETGMLPACLMGLEYKKFKQFNNLIKNKNFQNQLIKNVSAILDFHNKKKYNSIILNYDPNSQDLFYWYQQLVAESLGKKSKGILPIISTMPKDNHSLMQLYLDGNQNNFYTFFMVKNRYSNRIDKKNLINSHLYLSNKYTNDILNAQFEATQKVFKKKKIPFRSFVINNKNEKTLGELFCFFILETIMIGEALKINPFNQPEVELIKKETYKILKTNRLQK